MHAGAAGDPDVRGARLDGELGTERRLGALGRLVKHRRERTQIGPFGIAPPVALTGPIKRQIGGRCAPCQEAVQLRNVS